MGIFLRLINLILFNMKKTIAKVFRGIKTVSSAISDGYMKMHPGIGCGYYIPYDYYFKKGDKE